MLLTRELLLRLTRLRRRAPLLRTTPRQALTRWLASHSICQKQGLARLAICLRSLRQGSMPEHVRQATWHCSHKVLSDRAALLPCYWYYTQSA